MKRAVLPFFVVTIAAALTLSLLSRRGETLKSTESLPQLAQEVGVRFSPEARLIGIRRERGIVRGVPPEATHRQRALDLTPRYERTI